MHVVYIYGEFQKDAENVMYTAVFFFSLIHRFSKIIRHFNAIIYIMLLK